MCIIARSSQFWLIFIIITSTSAMDPQCSWDRFNRTQPVLKIVDVCQSLTIDSIFLGPNHHNLMKYKTLTDLTIRASLKTINDYAFIRAPNLQKLVLSKNRLSEISEDAFSGLKYLHHLWLDENHLQTLHKGTFYKLVELKYLNFDKNQLTTFDFSMLRHCSKIDWLLISRNWIHKVETTTPFSMSATTLSMERGNLTELSIDHLPVLPNLRSIFFDANGIIDLDYEGFVKKFPKLIEIHLAYNPFDCCYLREILQKLKEKFPKILFDQDLWENVGDLKALQKMYNCGECAKSFLNRRTIIKLEKEVKKDLRSLEKKFNIFISILGLVVITLLILRLVTGSKRRQISENYYSNP